MAWFEDLEVRKRDTVKADVHWFIEQHARLQKLHDELSTGTQSTII